MLKLDIHNKHAIHFRSNVITTIHTNGTIKHMQNISLDNNIVWINIVDFTKINNILKIHPITLEDIQNVSNVREKIEFFDDYIYTIIKNVDKQNISILLYDNFVLTIDNIDTEIIKKIVSKCNKFTPDIIFYGFIDNLIDNFEKSIHELVQNVDEFDNLIATDIKVDEKNHTKKIVKLNELKKLINFYYSTLSSKKNIISHILSKDNKFVPNERQIYFQDVFDNIIAMNDKVTTCKENIIQSQNNYTSLLSLEAAISSEKTNKVMTQLSSIATIMLPMTFIVGLFGMNVKVPGQGHDNLDWFFGITCILFFMVFVLGYLFKKWKYF